MYEKVYNRFGSLRCNKALARDKRHCRCNVLSNFRDGSYFRQLNNLPYDKIIEVYNANKKVTLSSEGDKKVVLLPD